MSFTHTMPRRWALLKWSARTSWWVLAHTGVIISLGIFFRLYQVENIPGVNGDEALMTVQVTEMTAGRPTVLKMPTGRMLSPVYGAVLLLTENLFANSFWTLRAPAFLSGILLIFSFFIWLPRVMAPGTARAAGLIAASLPVLIAYSRVGIEQCLIPLSSFYCLYAALRGNFRQLAFSFFIALLVHPVNVFLVPVLLGPVAARVLTSSRLNRYQKQTLVIGAFFLLYLGVMAEVFLLPEHYRVMIGGDQLWGRLTHPAYFGQFLKHSVRLLSGATAYEQYVQPLSGIREMVIDYGYGFLLTILFIAGTLQAWFLRRYSDLGLILGFIFSLFGFYLITGLNGITPGLARYSLFILVPFTVVLALLIELSLSRLSKASQVASVLVSIWVWLALAQFAYYYFADFQLRNAEPHRTYQSGVQEPKAAAWKWIQEQNPNGPHFLIAEDWWTYWPIRYLSIPKNNSKVFYFLSPEDPIQQFPLREEVSRMDQVLEVLRAGGFAIGFPDGPFASILPRLIPGSALEIKSIFGYGGKAVLQIYRMRK